jgi:AraC-like DNA-binding protein
VSLIEAALRGGAVVLLVLVAILLLRDARRVPAGVFSALFALGAACYTIVSASALASDSSHWLWPIRIVAMGNPVIFCLFAATLFNDDFKPSWLPALAWLLLVWFGIFSLWSGIAQMRWICSGLGLICNAIGVWYALAGRSLDLVEERRKLRAVLVIAVALYSAAIIISEIALPSGGGGSTLYLINSIGVLAITVVFAVVLLTVSREGALISLPQASAAIRPVPMRRMAAGIGQVERAGGDEDGKLLEALRRTMEEDKAYREEGLSIGSLAGRLGMAEHGLRRLINQRLGYRNFNAFLNFYRLDDVMGALADPAQESVPILTIALDAGFQSLGPFNRAFKAHTAMTPSEFRRQQLGRNGRVAAE